MTGDKDKDKAVGVNVNIPEKSAGRALDAFVDMFRPFSEAGMSAGQRLSTMASYVPPAMMATIAETRTEVATTAALKSMTLSSG